MIIRVRSCQASRKGNARENVDGKCSKIDIVFAESSAMTANREPEVIIPVDVSYTAVTVNEEDRAARLK